MPKILIVDDEVKLCWTVSNILQRENYETITAYDGNSAVAKIEQEYVDAVILDLKLPDMDGFQVLEKIKKINDEIPVIIMTAYGDVQSAVKAMKMGVLDFVLKPCEPHMLIITVKKVIERQQLNYEVIKLKQHLGYNSVKPDFVSGKSEIAKKLHQQIKKIASTEITVLLQGESGTGKGVFAKMIHNYSRRNNKLFNTIDCGAISENLIESELFGYEKGAFTGAVSRKLGQLEIANKGTLFIDEIGNLNLAVQSKLLRVLEERMIQRVGGEYSHSIDVRIIIATNSNLAGLVSKGSFREDLYHRLSGFIIKIPSLKERKDDIPVFIKQFIDESNKELDKHVKSISREAEKLLMDYDWPGNIRELKNTIKRAVLLADDIIEPEHLPEQVSSYKLRGKNNYAGKLKNIVRQEVEKIERAVIENTLKSTSYNKVEAAKLLGIDRKSLFLKRKKYNI